MNRFLPYLTILLSFNLLADDNLIEAVEKFTDIFGVSFSQFNGNTVATLDANYYLSDNLRIFGDVDTNLNWEIGSGYSFWTGETYYTENNIKISEHSVSSGIFGAKVLSQSWTLIGDINYNYNFSKNHCFVDICWEKDNANSFDYSAGFIWSPIRYIDWIYKFNHEVSPKENELNFDSSSIKLGQTNFHYHETVAVFNLKYIRPSITYTHFSEYEDSIEFGLSFDF